MRRYHRDAFLIDAHLHLAVVTLIEHEPPLSASGESATLASLDGLSSCAGLQTLELWRLVSLTSATGLTGCAALKKLDFKPGGRNCEKLSSMPDLSSLAGLEVVGLPSHLQAWEDGGRKRFELAQ